MLLFKARGDAVGSSAGGEFLTHITYFWHWWIPYLGIMGLGICWGEWQGPHLGTVCGWEGVCNHAVSSVLGIPAPEFRIVPVF